MRMQLIGAKAGSKISCTKVGLAWLLPRRRSSSVSTAASLPPNTRLEPVVFRCHNEWCQSIGHVWNENVCEFVFFSENLLLN